MANFNTFGDLSTTPVNNSIIAGVNEAEQCNMNGINDGIRALGAMGKGALTAVSTSGTDTYTATLAPVPDALATDFHYYVNFASTNTSTTPTLNLNSFGAKTITDMTGAALVAGALNGRHLLNYDGSNFRVLNPVKSTPMSDATNGGLTVTAGTIALNPNDLTAKTSRAAADSVVVNDVAGGNVAKKVTWPNALSGMPIQLVNTETGAVTNGTTQMPCTDAIPTSSQGDQYMSLSITPTNSSSTLVIDVVWNGATNQAIGGNLQMALYQDSTANSLANVIGTTIASGAPMQLVLRHKMTAGTTSATTFKVRAGGGAVNTTSFNGSGGLRIGGGLMASSLTITEILP